MRLRKMLKKLGVVIPSAVLTLLMAVGFSTPAFAYVEPEVKEEPAQVIEEEEPTEEEKIPFTIAGNGEVEDNITDDSSKEFFTVKTKGGNTFFLVIDRARNSENVYMLSMIDEYDLQEFLTDEERNGKEEEKPAVVLPETKPEPEPDVEIEEPEQDDGNPYKGFPNLFRPFFLPLRSSYPCGPHASRPTTFGNEKGKPAPHATRPHNHPRNGIGRGACGKNGTGNENPRCKEGIRWA